MDSVSSATFRSYLRSLRPGGRLVSLGATAGADVKLSLRELFFRQISVLGTSTGNPGRFEGMLRFVAEHTTRPMLHRASTLHEGVDASPHWLAETSSASSGLTDIPPRQPSGRFGNG